MGLDTLQDRVQGMYESPGFSPWSFFSRADHTTIGLTP